MFRIHLQSLPSPGDYMTLMVLCGLIFTVGGPASLSANDGLKIEYVDTPVKIRGADDLEWEQLDDTDRTLPPESDVLVEDGGALKLKDGAVATIKVNELSGVSLNTENDTKNDLFLNHGSMKLDVKQEQTNRSYDLKTNNATIGVRGTEFGISYERSEQSQVFVEDGEVSITASSSSDRISNDQSASVTGESGRLNTEDEIPEELNLTWSHWALKRQRNVLRSERDELNRRLQQLEAPLSNLEERQQDQLREALNFVESSLDGLRKRYSSVSEDYETFRNRLEEERGEFLQRRRQALNEYRRQRIKEIEEMREQRDERIEEMRDQRQDGIEKMREENR